MRGFAIAFTLCLSVAVAYAQQIPQFRTSTDAVIIDVSVRAGGQPVSGLTADDFELREDDVVQVIDEVEPFGGPVDVSLVLDEPHLRAGGLADAFARTLSEIRTGLTSDDSVKELWFDRGVRSGATDDVMSLTPRDGGVLFDALTAAAMSPPTAPDRKHVIVAITPGLDRYGALAHEQRLRVLVRSGVVVHIVAIADDPRSFFGVGTYSTATRQVTSHVDVGSYDPLLAAVSNLTGGRFFAATSNESTAAVVLQAIDDFRTRYWIRYRPIDTESKGYRRVSIKVLRSGRYDVRSRAGYWRD